MTNKWSIRDWSIGIYERFAYMSQDYICAFLEIDRLVKEAKKNKANRKMNEYRELGIIN